MLAITFVHLPGPWGRGKARVGGRIRREGRRYRRYMWVCAVFTPTPSVKSVCECLGAEVPLRRRALSVGIACTRFMEAVMGVAAGPIRVVVAKPGLDGHDRGAKVIARALRDAGMEVIYTGLHQTPEQIVDTAIQEDADAIGLSILSGAHNTLFAAVIALLKERDAEDILVFGGGIIPEADIPPLKEKGVAEIFTPGATTASIVDWVRTNVRQPAET